MTPYEDKIILVNDMGEAIGSCEKLAAHREARLHRAFSVFLFDGSGRWLLQKRHKGKYHSGGLWSNACCSHPRPDEDTGEAAHRRLFEELSVVCDLKEAFTFTYEHRFDSGLVENEYDHVFLGEFTATPYPAPEEVEDWRWVSQAVLEAEIEEAPDAFSYWMRACFDKVVEARRASLPTRDVPHFKSLAI